MTTEQQWLTSEDPYRMLASLCRDWDKGEEYYAISDRKLRLYASACWRHLWKTPAEQAEAAAVEAWADGGLPPPAIPVHWVNQPSAADSARDAAQSMWPRDARRGADLLREIVGSPFREVRFCGSASLHPDHLDRGLLTPTVVSLVHAAYDERQTRQCESCEGKGEYWHAGFRGSRTTLIKCEDCPSLDAHHGTGQVEEGYLDPFRLMVLADALEEAGCPTPTGRRTRSDVIRQRANAVAGGCCNRFADYQGCTCLEEAEPDSILTHLRSPGPHVRGCWVLDLLLGYN